MSNRDRVKSGSVPPSGLTSEKRMDKHGRIVTRWVRDGSANSAPSTALNNRAPVDSSSSVPTSINWNTVPRFSATKIAIEAGKHDNIADPKKLWQNFDFYTGMLESQHSDIALAFMKDDEVALKLKSAWLKIHDYPRPEVCKGIVGDSGWDAYEAASKTLTDAAQAASVTSGNPELQGFAKELVARHDATVANADDIYDQRNRPVSVDETPEPTVVEPVNETRSFFSRLKEAKEDGDITEPFREEFDDVADVTEAAVGDILHRHSGDTPVPEDVGGSTFAWSDFNPFKRRKK